MAFGAEVANLIVQLKLDDSGFTGKLNNAARTLGRMDAGLARVGRGTGQLGVGLARLGTVAVATAAAGLGAVVGTAVSFEDAFAGVRKTVDASDEDLDILMDTFREMARTIPVSFEELAGIGEQAGALGIATDAIDEFTHTVALLGETTDLTTEAAGTSLGVLANVLHLREEDFDNFGSALVDLGNKGASTESQILGIAERAGAGAALIDIAADATLGWSAAAANLGIDVEAGGTALQRFFLGTLNNIQDDDTLQVMAETAGTTADAFREAFERDASGALATFIDGLADLDEASQLDVLENLGFNDVRIQRLLLGLAGDADALAESLDIAGAAWEDNTALQTEAAKRFETTRSKLDLLIGNLRDVAFVIGNEVIPIVADLSTDFVNFLNEPGTQEGIRDFAKNLAGGIRDLARELKGTDFSGIIGGMKLAAEIAKGAFDLFRSLPQPIQQLAIAAIVGNRVTGGAIGQIAKGLGNIAFGGLQGGIAGIFGGRGTTPANPLFVSQVGGLPGGGAGGAASTAGGLAIRSLLGVTSAVALGAFIGNEIGKEFFFNPTIKTAVEFEQGQIDRIVESNDSSSLVEAIGHVDSGISDMRLDLGPLEWLPITGQAIGAIELLTNDQYNLLKEQRQTLVDQLLAQGYTQEAIDRMIYAQEQQTERDAVYDGRRGGEADKQQADDAAMLLEAKQNRTDIGSNVQGVSAAVVTMRENIGARIIALDQSQSGHLKTVAERVAEARDRLSGSNEKLSQIIAKDWSHPINLSQTVTVNTVWSAVAASDTMTVVNEIRGRGDGSI